MARMATGAMRTITTYTTRNHNGDSTRITADQIQAGSTVTSSTQPMMTHMATSPNAGARSLPIRRLRNRREVPLV